MGNGIAPRYFDAFDWDPGNARKNLIKHKVTVSEIEQVFFNPPVRFGEDVQHSGGEKRYFALGLTESRRKLAITFTMRGNRIRIISARDMSRRERRYYEDEIKTNPPV